MLGLCLTLLLGFGEPPLAEPAPAEPASAEPAPAEPAQPVGDPETVIANADPPAGGFGSIDSVTIDSNVQAPPPPTPLEPEGPPEPELSALVQAGYTQNDLGNSQGLDHHGLYLRAHFVYYPWISRKRVIGAGLGALYSYHGLNRWQNLPEGTPASEAQQQLVMISADLLLRPHQKWFSILISGGIGLGFYSNAKVYAADRRATIAKDEYAFVGGGSLGLCTAWGIVCVVGGAQALLHVETWPITPIGQPLNVDPWGWQTALGVDVLRIMARANAGPS